MRKLNLKKDIKGSISVEASISFPLVILIFAAFIRILLILQIDNKFERVLYNATLYIQENPIVLDIGESYSAKKTKDVIAKEKFKRYIVQGIKDSNLENLIINLQYTNLNVYPGDLDVFDYSLTYSIYDIEMAKNNIFNVARKGVVSTEISNVWQMPPLIRGKILRERFGGNLRYNYPVISRFINHEATVIKSINPDSLSYLKKDAIYNKIKQYIIKLDEYNKLVNGKKIYTKRIILIIPVNAENPYLENDIIKLKQECIGRTIEFEMIPYGKIDN